MFEEDSKRDDSYPESKAIDAATTVQPHFGDGDRAGFHRLVKARRDVRHFSGGHVDDEVLARLLEAAHHAPSVGLMQPWRYLRVVDPAVRAGLVEAVEKERVLTAEALGERAQEFMRLKVEGLRECAEVLAVILAPDDGTVFGRRTMGRDMALCSLACSVQNLWLAARAENLGMGWVSMFEPADVAALLGLPDGAQAMGLLCLGPVDRFQEAPMLEIEDWRHRRPIDELVFVDRWGQGSA